MRIVVVTLDTFEVDGKQERCRYETHDEDPATVAHKAHKLGYAACRDQAGTSIVVPWHNVAAIIEVPDATRN